MKPTIFILGCLIFLSLSLSGQDLNIWMPEEPKPIISVTADINKYWNVEKSGDSLPTVLREHYDAMRVGRRYSFTLAVHLETSLCVGVEYFYAHTAHTTPEDYWMVNGVPRRGSIGESIYHNFYGAYVNKYFKLNRDYSLGFGISAGILSYVHYRDFAGYWSYLDGQDLAIDLHVEGLFTLDQNWALYMRGSYVSTVIVTPHYTDNTHSRVPLNNQPINLSNLRLGVGMRYTFTKRE